MSVNKCHCEHQRLRLDAGNKSVVVVVMLEDLFCSADFMMSHTCTGLDLDLTPTKLIKLGFFLSPTDNKPFNLTCHDKKSTLLVLQVSQ